MKKKRLGYSFLSEGRFLELVVVLFDPWLPAIEGALLMIVAIEQLYIFRFVFQGYRLLRDRLLLLVSVSFIVLAVGSIVSAATAFQSFAVLLRSPVSPEGFQIMRSVIGLLSFFEVVGFAIMILAPPLLKGERIDERILPQFAVIAGVATYREYIVGAAMLVLAVLFLLIVSRTRTFKTIESNAIIAALLALFFSKWVILLPFTFKAVDVISVIMEAVAFSAFVVLRETIAFSMPSRAARRPKR